MDSMMVSWWIVAFLHSEKCQQSSQDSACSAAVGTWFLHALQLEFNHLQSQLNKSGSTILTYQMVTVKSCATGDVWHSSNTKSETYVQCTCEL